MVRSRIASGLDFADALKECDERPGLSLDRKQNAR
jgi:hypothetical protein